MVCIAIIFEVGMLFSFPILMPNLFFSIFRTFQKYFFIDDFVGL